MATYNPNGRKAAQTEEHRPTWRAEDDVYRGRGEERDEDRYASDRDRDVDRERGSSRWSGWSGSDRREMRVGEGREEGFRSTERYGQGQSGYTSGRYGEDRSIGISGRNQGYAGGYEERRWPSTEDRFTGRGGQGYWMDRGDREVEDRGRWRERAGYVGSRGMEGIGPEMRGYGSQGYGSQGGMQGYGSQGGMQGYGSQGGMQGYGSQGGMQGYGSQGWQGGMQGYGSQGPGQGRVGGYARDVGGMGFERGGHRGKGPQGYTRSDERIRENVCEALTDDDNVDATNIEVTVRNGEVILTGTVDDRFTKRMAEEVVERVSGVKDVQNQLKVRERRGNQVGTQQVGKQEAESSDKRHRA